MKRWNDSILVNNFQTARLMYFRMIQKQEKFFKGILCNAYLSHMRTSSEISNFGSKNQLSVSLHVSFYSLWIYFINYILPANRIYIYQVINSSLDRRGENCQRMGNHDFSCLMARGKIVRTPMWVFLRTM